MDFPAHDPRGRGGLGVAYATSNRGACHMQAYNQDFEGEGCFNIADLGYDAPMPPYTNEGKGKFVADQQHFMSMMDSLKLCKFSIFGGMTVGPMTQFLNHITGWDFTNEQWIECGERIFNMKRLFNTREGISRKDDTCRLVSSLVLAREAPATMCLTWALCCATIIEPAVGTSGAFPRRKLLSDSAWMAMSTVRGSARRKTSGN